MSMMRNLRWPPPGLELGAPYLSAIFHGQDARNFWQMLWQSIAAGAGAAAAVIFLDHVLFAGVSLERIIALGAAPLGLRLIVIVYSALAEETIYRLGIMTFVVWLAMRMLSRYRSDALVPSMWLGILVAAGLFGLAHVANIPDAPQPVARAVTLNGLAGVVTGWLYWKRGFEAAVIAHLTAGAVIYLGVASVL